MRSMGVVSIALVALGAVSACCWRDFGDTGPAYPDDPTVTDAGGGADDGGTTTPPTTTPADASAPDTTDPACIAGGGACVLDRDCCTGTCSGVAASGARYCVDDPPTVTRDGGAGDGGASGDDAASHVGPDGASSCPP